MQVSPSIQSQGIDGSVTSTTIPEGSLWGDNGVGFESSDIGEYGLGAGEESQAKGYLTSNDENGSTTALRNIS
jgi:hypothetical protein